MYSALIADDSLFIRKSIRKFLEKIGLTVVAEATNGLETIAKVQMIKPDFVFMDIIMPKMDGLTALKEIMEISPTKIIVISAYNPEHINGIFLALEYGAIDFLPKAIISDETYDFMEKMRKKIEFYSSINISRENTFPHLNTVKRNNFHIYNQLIKSEEQYKRSFPHLIIIGASSGGPKVIQHILTKLTPPFPPIIVIQHLPKGISFDFALRLNKLVNFTIKEATDGEPLLMNTIYIAPSGKHLVFNHIDNNKSNKIYLFEGDRVNGVMPSLDPTILSASYYYKKKLLLIILTGMGVDGLAGARYAKHSGAKIIVQNEESCQAFSMPKAIIDANLADFIFEPSKISSYINLMSNGSMINV